MRRKEINRENERLKEREKEERLSLFWCSIRLLSVIRSFFFFFSLFLDYFLNYLSNTTDQTNWTFFLSLSLYLSLRKSLPHLPPPSFLPSPTIKIMISLSTNIKCTHNTYLESYLSIPDSFPSLIHSLSKYHFHDHHHFSSFFSILFFLYRLLLLSLSHHYWNPVTKHSFRSRSGLINDSIWTTIIINLIFPPSTFHQTPPLFSSLLFFPHSFSSFSLYKIFLTSPSTLFPIFLPRLQLLLNFTMKPSCNSIRFICTKTHQGRGRMSKGKK